MDHTHHDHHKEHEQNYSCPMHPEVIKPAPGKCPKCGMDLVLVEQKTGKQQPRHKHHHQEHLGYDKHAGHHTGDFLNRFWVCLALTADITLVNSDREDVAVMINFGRSTYRKMKQNLAWAIGYNVAAIPLAAGVLYPHFRLSPAMGAVLMSLNTIIVAINARSLRLK